MIDIVRTITDIEPTNRCAANHIAPWMVWEEWFVTAVNHYNSRGFPIEAAKHDDEPRVLFAMDSDGIAHISLLGFMMKHDSKFGGTSTIRTRRAVRLAKKDPDVKALLLNIDSPGGTVSGTEELGRDVANAAKVKPVYAHIADLGASAAIWVASQAGHVSANATALVGSIGTVSVIEDSSAAFEKKGITVHVISTGKFKSAGVDGAPVTDDHLAELQELVDDLNEHFVAAVAEGRNMTVEAVEAIADGKVHIASKAEALGLIDVVQPFDATVELIRSDIAIREKETLDRSEAARRRVRGESAFSP